MSPMARQPARTPPLADGDIRRSKDRACPDTGSCWTGIDTLRSSIQSGCGGNRRRGRAVRERVVPQWDALMCRATMGNVSTDLPVACSMVPRSLSQALGCWWM